MLYGWELITTQCYYIDLVLKTYWFIRKNRGKMRHVPENIHLYIQEGKYLRMAFDFEADNLYSLYMDEKVEESFDAFESAHAAVIRVNGQNRTHIGGVSDEYIFYDRNSAEIWFADWSKSTPIDKVQTDFTSISPSPYFIFSKHIKERNPRIVDMVALAWVLGNIVSHFEGRACSATKMGRKKYRDIEGRNTNTLEY